MSHSPAAPGPDCNLCPRLAQYRHENRKNYPDKFNAPVPSFGSYDAELLVVGLAPGLKGANFTGRPFTGDYAGDLLYKTLLKYSFAEGQYGARPDDGVRLVNCRITNAVRCVPPQNKPTGPEIKKCQPFLERELATMPSLKVILALGKIAHDAVIRTCGLKMADFSFAHAAIHNIPNRFTLIDSYHCSRYNTQTGRLTDRMFYEVFDKITGLVAADAPSRQTV